MYSFICPFSPLNMHANILTVPLHEACTVPVGTEDTVWTQIRQGFCPNYVRGRCTNNDSNEHVSSSPGQCYEEEADYEGGRNRDETEEGCSHEGVMNPRRLNRTQAKEESGGSPASREQCG